MSFPADMIAQSLKMAFDEVLSEHPEFEDDVEEFGLLVAEALTTSPNFSWAGGNIWHDVDATVKN